MPEYLSPGVYVEELSIGPRPIEGVSTSTAAMLGATERGPIPPRMVSSWLEYQRWYGGYMDPAVSYLPYAVEGFFKNGGQRLYVGRVFNGPPLGQPYAFQPLNGLNVQAIGPGEWGNRIYVRITQGTKNDGNNDYFRLTVLYFDAANEPPDPANVTDPLTPGPANDPNRRTPQKIEDYDNLVITPGRPNSVETVVNTASQLVRVWLAANPPAAVNAPVQAPYAQLAQAAIGADAPLAVNDFTGDLNPVQGGRAGELLGSGFGLEAMAAIDDISLLMIPDAVRPPDPALGQTDLRPLNGLLVDQCERLRDRFAVLAIEQGQNTAALARASQVMARDTSYAGVYYPWIEIYDPISRGPLLIPPTGHIAGLIARTDIERGVFKAPANEVVRGATNLEFPVTKAMQDELNPRGVNCIRDFRPDGRGLRLWGARTPSSDPLWKYVNVRRLFLFLEESIDEGTQWVVFEPNDEPLWAQVRRTIESFLTGVWRSGALMGTAQEQAFFVKCDRTTMTTDDIDNGRLVCYIGVAPVKPAEFVIFRISQMTVEAQQ